ncbi:MAG TPA: DUF1254 domain-containing protein [Streptosporangiaceae bacterium]|jgi:hypothetical protein
MPDQDLAALASEAFYYGYPLVADLDEVIRFTRTGMGSVPAASLNHFSHARTLAGPADTFVTINNDTLYSIAQLDLSAGPLELSVPDTGDRYYVLQFIDAWTNNFAYVGTRASGSAARSYLVTPPGWARPVPDGVTQIPAPTQIATILGRWACDGPGDLPEVHGLQDRLSLHPVSRQRTGTGVQHPASVPAGLEFFEKMRVWMAAFPPAEPDRDYQQRFGPLGLLAGASPYPQAPADLTRALADGLAAGQAKLEAFTRTGTVQKVNGWMMGLHMFDYNLDFFGPGVIDDPQWKKPDRASAYPERALAARVGFWGNHAYEATYAQIFQDDRGEQLTGSRHYEIRFSELPPVRAFWSLTMYDIPSYYLIANPAGRYSIGDRTPGLRYAPDGSLTIAIQADPPADETRRANWLPAPPGDFRPIMRLYEPGPEILHGTYTLPPINRLD